MVYLQKAPAVSLAHFPQLCRSMAAQWYRGCPYFSFGEELGRLINYLQRWATVKQNTRNAILINDKSVTLITPDGTTRTFLHKLWGVEIHYQTSMKSLASPMKNPVCTLRLINRKKSTAETFTYDPERIEAAVRFCLSKKIMIKEFRNGKRVHLGKVLNKKERRTFNSQYKMAF